MKLLKNRTVLGILCIVLSLAICFLVTPLFNQAISQKTEIVRVQKAIKAGDEITKDKVQMVEVGGYNLPGDVMKELGGVVGAYATADRGYLASYGAVILCPSLHRITARWGKPLYHRSCSMSRSSQ